MIKTIKPVEKEPLEKPKYGSHVSFFRTFAALIPSPRTRYASLARSLKRSVPATYHTLLSGLEKLRNERGAFVAADSDDYNACWIRDQLYSTFAYYYLGETKKFSDGIRVVFDIFSNSKEKLERGACVIPSVSHEYLHAKYHPDTFGEITDDWGHHQVDAIGLFLYMVAFAEKNGVRVVESPNDREILQLLVSYLTIVKYWEAPDNGMWEEGLDMHTSSIGAAVKGLLSIKDAGLALVPNELIKKGGEAIAAILPNESPNREVDMAQLSLIWPYNILSEKVTETVIGRVEERLVRAYGLQRYWDDNYYRSDDGISAEWTMGFFWMSIIASRRGKTTDAHDWFIRGMSTITSAGELPELYQNGKPNKNTPLAWSHSLALIAAIHLVDHPLQDIELVNSD